MKKSILPAIWLVLLIIGAVGGGLIVDILHWNNAGYILMTVCIVGLFPTLPMAIAYYHDL